MLGSSDDTDRCDLQLVANRYSGISRQHIRIDMSPTMNCPRLTVLSNNPVLVVVHEVGSDRTVTISKGQSLEILDPATIDFGTSCVRAWRPILSSSEETRYRRHAEQFSKDFLDSLPANLSIHSDPLPEPFTFGLRFGKNNTVYRVVEKIGSGSSASVMKVVEVHSKKIYAAKEPYFKATDSASEVRKRWEESKVEYEKLVKLKHVSEGSLNKMY